MSLAFGKGIRYYSYYFEEKFAIQFLCPLSILMMSGAEEKHPPDFYLMPAIV